MSEKRRTRRTAEEMIQVRADKIAQLENAISDIEKQRAAMITSYNEKIAKLKDKIAKLRAADMRTTELKPRKRRTKAEKMQCIIEQAKKSGMSLDEIAERLGVTNDQ